MIIDLSKEEKNSFNFWRKTLTYNKWKLQEIKKPNIILIKDIVRGATLSLNDKVKIISGKLINKNGKLYNCARTISKDFVGKSKWEGYCNTG